MLRRYLLVYLLVAASAATAQDTAKTSPAASTPGTVLVTGANRGLGLEFARQYAAAGWNVIATARDPEHAAELRALAAANRKIAIDALDVTDHASIAALAAKHARTPIDVLINNAGVLGDLDAQKLGSLDHAEFERVMDVNVYGALAVAEAFRDSVAASSQKKIVSITSRSGEISQPGYRGPYFYRASKIALNMVMRVLADDLRERARSSRTARRVNVRAARTPRPRRPVARQSPCRAPCRSAPACPARRLPSPTGRRRTARPRPRTRSARP